MTPRTIHLTEARLDVTHARELVAETELKLKAARAQLEWAEARLAAVDTEVAV